MSKDIIDLALNQIKGRKNPLDEMTAANGAGAYSIPLTPGTRIFDKDALEPYTIKVSKYDDAQLAYDSYDGKLNVPKKKAKQMEKRARKISNYIKNHPKLNDDDGDNLNQTPQGKARIDEDLAVWFGKKKKPKGSSQPKGPWVNICRKVNGKHPPCGRPEATSKGYPKCRAAGVAGKMSDSQKRAACAQKRKAEKTHSKSGTGNKPKMVSYKTKKKVNEMVNKIISLLKN